MQTINLDLSVRSIIPLLHAKQGDVGRKFKAILTDGGAAYAVPAGAVVSVWYSGASGEGNYTDIGADRAVSISNNEITVELITQMLANYGDGKLCLAINTADGDQIGTWNIPYMVEPLPGLGSAAAQQYFTAFSQAVQNLPYPDTTLSVPGRAADAGAVGTALASKSPAGYGYDGNASPDVYNIGNDANGSAFNATLDAIVATMPNRTVRQILFVDNPIAGSTEHFGTLYRHNENYCVLTGWSYSGGIIRKYKSGGGWFPWEWVNPPMEVGVEYRTTERWNGKPVYAKCVDFGALPNTEEKIVYHGISGVDNMIYASASAWVGNEVLIINSNTYYVNDFKAGQTSVAIRTNADMTSWTNCVFTLKYTKN